MRGSERGILGEAVNLSLRFPIPMRGSEDAFVQPIRWLWSDRSRSP